SLFLDTRRAAFDGTLFELAVTAAASIGVHLADEGFDARFVTDSGEVPRQGTFRDTLLDTLAVVRPSRSTGLDPGIGPRTAAGGQTVAVLGQLTDSQARQLSGTRRGTAPGLALLLDQDGSEVAGRATKCAQILTGAGWRVSTVPDAARLPAAWQQLHEP